MDCKIFKSEKQDQSYLYLERGHEFEDLPEALRESFGTPEFVMDLDLAKTPRLARVDKAKVMESLRANGYFVQLPPRRPVEEEITAWLNKPAK
jgi:hypothetical protein